MDKYGEWLRLSKAFKVLKAKELKLRKELCQDLFRGKVPPNKLKFITENNFSVEAEAGMGTKLDTVMVNQIYKELSDTEKNALKYTPELIMKYYNKLPDNCLLKEAVTTKPSTPTLKVVKIEA